MKIIIDKNIPFLRGILENHADIVYLDGDAISSKTASDADALLIRTRTRCDSELLKGTRVKFIGSATIGTDHIDTIWCDNNGVKWANAPGCNSGSVMQYIGSALLHLSEKHQFDPANKVLGIVGAGNVGSKVEKMAKILGMEVLLNDPPRERAEGKGDFISLDELTRRSDIISFHVPLNRSGKDRTIDLAGNKFFDNLRPGSFIINSCRGSVVNETLLVSSLRSGMVAGAVTDVWSGEPAINTELLALSEIGTPHIAGYSLDGKWNASRMILEQLSLFFGLKTDISLLPPPVEPLNGVIRITRSLSTLQKVKEAVTGTYDITSDSDRLKDNPSGFEKLRNNYPPRREFHAYKAETDGEAAAILKKLGFKL